MPSHQIETSPLGYDGHNPPPADAPTTTTSIGVPASTAPAAPPVLKGDLPARASPSSTPTTKLIAELQSLDVSAVEAALVGVRGGLAAG